MGATQQNKFTQFYGGVKNMKKEDKDKVINALSEFVVRVANGKATSETEVAVLPEVAKILLVFDS